MPGWHLGLVPPEASVLGFFQTGSSTPRVVWRKFAFWTAHAALVASLLAWICWLEPSFINRVSVAVTWLLPGLLALGLHRRLLMGRWLRRLGRPRSAVRNLEAFLAALQRRPWMAESFALLPPTEFASVQAMVRGELGRAHRQLGELLTARVWIRAAIDYEPDAARLREELHELDKALEQRERRHAERSKYRATRETSSPDSGTSAVSTTLH